LGLFAQLILLPLVAFAIVYTFQLVPALAVGVMILASAPVGAASNLLTKLAYGDESLSVTLTALTSLASLVMMPIVVRLTVGYFYGDSFVDRIPVNDLVGNLLVFSTIPLVLGVAVRQFADKVAINAEGLVSLVANGLFLSVMSIVILRNWELLSGQIVLLTVGLILMNLTMFLFSWLFSAVFKFPGPVAVAVVVETGMQNVLIAAFVGSILATRVVTNTFEGLSTFALPAAVYGVTSLIVIAPFVLIRRMAALSAVR
jgi:BASS family bile acid:Na+ symporter